MITHDPDATDTPNLWSALAQARVEWLQGGTCLSCQLPFAERHDARAAWREAAADLLTALVVVDAQQRRDPTVDPERLLIASIEDLTGAWRAFAQRLESAPDDADRCRARILTEASDQLETAARQVQASA